MKHSYFSTGILLFGMVWLTACSGSSSSRLSSLPDTSPTALAKPLIASAETVQVEPETTPGVATSPLPEVVAEIPEETPTSPPPALEEKPQTPGSEVGETKPKEPKPTPPRVSTPCNDIHRSEIKSMQNSIDELAAYLATLPDNPESLEKDNIGIDLVEARISLAKYKRDHGCN